MDYYDADSELSLLTPLPAANQSNFKVRRAFSDPGRLCLERPRTCNDHSTEFLEILESPLERSPFHQQQDFADTSPLQLTSRNDSADASRTFGDQSINNGSSLLTMDRAPADRISSTTSRAMGTSLVHKLSCPRGKDDVISIRPRDITFCKVKDQRETYGRTQYFCVIGAWLKRGSRPSSVFQRRDFLGARKPASTPTKRVRPSECGAASGFCSLSYMVKHRVQKPQFRAKRRYETMEETMEETDVTDIEDVPQDGMSSASGSDTNQ